MRSESGGSGEAGERAPSTVAQQIAAVVRARILSGQQPRGSTLPSLERLAQELAASKPTVRQGLQILEAEGLITVKRGRRGGAVVHSPPSDEVHVFLDDVSGEDLSAALRHLEPICAALCAGRSDRDESVLPRLRAVHQLGADAIDDPQQWSAAARAFHEALVGGCGNTTIVRILGAVESLCTSRASAWATGSDAAGPAAVHDPAYRRRGFDDHALILAFIERGDAEAASRETARHLQWVPVYPPVRP